MILLYGSWLRLPINLRHKIANDLGIPKKHPTHVQDNVIVSDGYDIHDVENALTVTALQTYLGVGIQETDINVLWEMLVNPPSHEVNVVIEPVIVVPPVKKAGRPKKNAK